MVLIHVRVRLDTRNPTPKVVDTMERKEAKPTVDAARFILGNPCPDSSSRSF